MIGTINTAISSMSIPEGSGVSREITVNPSSPIKNLAVINKIDLYRPLDRIEES
jgi:hypothetical protein